MPSFDRKYSGARLCVALFFLQALLWGGCGRMRLADRSLPAAQAADTVSVAGGALMAPVMPDSAAMALDSLMPAVPADSVIAPDSASISLDSLAAAADSAAIPLDSLSLVPDSLAADSLLADSLGGRARPRFDSLGRRDYGDPFIDDVITATNTDSLVYDARTGRFIFYKDVEILMTEQQAELKNSDFVEIDRNTRMIYAHGVTDPLGIYTRPTFIDKGHEYDMDSIAYNLNSGKMKIRGVWTTEGEGFLRGAAIKKMPDNTFNIIKGTYTTCDDPHPHYEIRLSRGKTIPGQKTIFQWAYLVIEDVPIPFPAVPFGFFPMNSQRSSGFIMPSFGEEYVKGFYLRDIGYQYSPNDYMSMRLLGSIFTLGSWEASLATNYRLRYKFSGAVNLRYANNKFGDRGSIDYGDSKTYSIAWSHQQDPKSGVNFSANVNFTSSQENRYTPTTIADFATNQTNSSISYQKSWAGTPFNLSVSAQHSQINRDSTYSFTLPNLTFSMSRVNPFKFKNRRPGPDRWYEKIALSYQGSFNNSVSGVKEYDLFKQPMYDKLNTTASHSVPISASFTVLDFINLTVGGTYRENWNTSRSEQRWDEQTQQKVTETVRGFNRVYDFGGSVSANTMIYGTFEFAPWVRVAAIRHTITPNVSFNLRPDFGKPMFGFYEWVQNNASGDYTYYSPYTSAPSPDAQASMNFSLSQTLEAKVRDNRDTTGVRKIKIIDDFSISGISYDFLDDSLKLSTSIPVTLRSTLFKGFNINISTSIGITAVDASGRPINRYFWQPGAGSAGAGVGAVRVERFSTSFNKSWSFGAGAGSIQASNNRVNDPLYGPNGALLDPFTDPEELEDVAEAEAQRQEAIAAYRNLLSSQYYDFSVPLTFSISGSISYSNNGVNKEITPTTSFNATANLTPKWGLTIGSGFDFNAMSLVKTTSFTLTRDLHCMQMNFNWIPLGPMKSWNFHISVKANILRDLKYEKSGSRYDNMMFDRR